MPAAWGVDVRQRERGCERMPVTVRHRTPDGHTGPGRDLLSEQVRGGEAKSPRQHNSHQVLHTYRFHSYHLSAVNFRTCSLPDDCIRLTRREMKLYCYGARTLPSEVGCL